MPNSQRGSVHSNYSGHSLPAKGSNDVIVGMCDDDDDVNESEIGDIYNIDAIPLKPL